MQEELGLLLEVEHGSPELLRKLARVMMLPEQIMEVVNKEFPSRAAIQKHWLVPVNNAFVSQNLSGIWQTFNAHIKEHVVDFLALTSDLIDEKTTSDDIDDEELSSIRSKFVDIQLELNNSGLPEGVRRSINKAISRVLMALDDYKISGSAEMLAAIDMALGKAVYDSEYRSSLSESEIGQRFLAAIHVLASVVTVVGGVPLITDGISKMIAG